LPKDDVEFDRQIINSDNPTIELMDNNRPMHATELSTNIVTDSKFPAEIHAQKSTDRAMYQASAVDLQK